MLELMSVCFVLLIVSAIWSIYDGIKYLHAFKQRKKCEKRMKELKAQLKEIERDIAWLRQTAEERKAEVGFK